jgi:allantoinase
MPLDLIIRGGTVVRPDGVASLHIGIENEKIVELGTEISGSAKEEIDATGLHIFPGVIDPHVHFNEPGREDWEGLTTGPAALAAGGGTLFFDMPLNSSPPVLDAAAFDAKVEAARAKSVTDFALWGGLTPKNVDRMEELAERGVIGFKAFMSNSGIDEFPRADDLTLLEGMRKAKHLNLPVAVHAESEDITSRLARRAIDAQKTSMQDFLGSRPFIAEVEAVARAIFLAECTGCKLHFVHLSTDHAVREVRRHRNADVTCETCPHYLALGEADAVRLGAIAKCAPPLRNPVHPIFLGQSLLVGEIDFVASDHSPAPMSMKQSSNAFENWGGISGCQSLLPTVLTYALKREDKPLERVAQITSSAAAKRFRIANKGDIEPGRDADLVLIDTKQTYTLREEDLFYRHKVSPFIGREFRGRIQRTILRGHTIFQDGKIMSKPIGRLVKPA